MSNNCSTLLIKIKEVISNLMNFVIGSYSIDINSIYDDYLVKISFIISILIMLVILNGNLKGIFLIDAERKSVIPIYNTFVVLPNYLYPFVSTFKSILEA